MAGGWGVVLGRGVDLENMRPTIIFYTRTSECSHDNLFESDIFFFLFLYSSMKSGNRETHCKHLMTR